MKFTTQDAVRQFRAWGRRQRQLPPGEKAIRDRFIAAMPAPRPIAIQRPSFYLPRFSLILMLLAAVTTIATPEKIANFLNPPAPDKTISYLHSASGPSDTTFGLAATAGAANFSARNAVPGSDTREFMKVHYRAEVKTRRVEEHGARFAVMIRGYDGRIDHLSLGEREGRIEFVIPKNQLMSLRDELRRDIGKKFLTETIAMNNELPTKRLLEEKKLQTENNLAAWKKDRAALLERHTAAVNDLTKQRTAVQSRLTATTDEAAKSVHQRELKTIEQKLDRENRSFGGEINAMDAKIANAETELTRLETQDSAFLASVDNVTGVITFDWISILDIVGLHLPKHWIPLAFVFLAVLVYLNGRRNSNTIELA